MTAENKFARIMRNTGPARFFVPLGVILIIFGIIMLSFNTDTYIKTTGKITAVTEVEMTGVDEENGQQGYDVDIVYTVNGKEYTTTFSNIAGEYKKGESIDLYYDPENPERTTNTKADFLPIVMIVAGAVALIFGVYKTVDEFKKSKGEN